MPFFAVRLRRGGPWDWSRPMREQPGWEAHAAFMDGLAASGFIRLGGPLPGPDEDPEGGRDSLHLVEAAGEEQVRGRLAEDPWSRSGMVEVAAVERWTLLLGAIDGARTG